MLAVAIINYRTAEATVKCATICASLTGPETAIYLLDNGSGASDVGALRELSATFPSIRLLQSQANVGFAAGMNLLLGTILLDEAVDQVLLLNSDTEPTPSFIAAMQARLDPAARIDMIAAKMLDAKSGNVDTLGITLFRSTLASNRKRDDEKLLGPSGGCALMTRRLLEDLRAEHGEWFDETFFCYAEDTDFAVRARWLGYRAGYAPDAIVHHAGSLSSGGPENDFVLYHGIRNSLWWLVKNAPLGWFLRSLPWFVALHAGIVLRHLRRGRARVVWRLYRDAIRGIGAMRRKRAIIRRTRRVPAREFSSWVEPHFYQRDYVRRAWRELFRPSR